MNIDRYNPNSHNESSYFHNQMKVVYEAFTEEPCSMLMASHQTGVERANICRYVAKWREYDKIVLIGFKPCSITQRKVGYYTTIDNPNYNLE